MVHVYVLHWTIEDFGKFTPPLKSQLQTSFPSQPAITMSRGGGTTYEKVLSQADDVADNILRHSKHYLPHLARLCLIATFLEDGLRMWFQWREQKDYINLTWRCGEFLGHVFVLVNMVFQLAGCVMVLIRRYVPVAVGLLFAVILIQVRLNGVKWVISESGGF